MKRIYGAIWWFFYQPKYDQFPGGCKYVSKKMDQIGSLFVNQNMCHVKSEQFLPRFLLVFFLPTKKLCHIKKDSFYPQG